MCAADVAYPRSAEGRAPLFGASLQLFGQIHRIWQRVALAACRLRGDNVWEDIRHVFQLSVLQMRLAEMAD